MILSRVINSLNKTDDFIKMINSLSKTGLGRSGHVRIPTFHLNLHIFHMILHGFAWRSSKNTVLRPKDINSSLTTSLDET